jgi:hypothetical protein
MIHPQSLLNPRQPPKTGQLLRTYGDINDISWPSSPAALWTNKLTGDGKLKDLSGNENHGTITGALFVNGPWGKCLQFDGVDDLIQVADSASLNPAMISIVALLNPNSGYGVVLSKNSIGSQYYCYWDGATNHRMSLGVKNTLGVGGELYSAYIYSGEFSLWVGIWNGTTLKVKTDAHPEATYSFSGTLKTTDGVIKIGATGMPWGGKLAALGIYDRDLSSERAALFSQLSRD